MDADKILSLSGAPLSTRCAQSVMGWQARKDGLWAAPGDTSCAGAGHRWDGRDTAHPPFNPSGDVAHALRLVERLEAADFVLHRFAGEGPTPPFWMAWFGDCTQATGDTPAEAVCRAALLYVLEKKQARQSPTAGGPGAATAPTAPECTGRRG